MTSQPEASADIEYCARHPQVETALRCGRCETLICPQCLVHTPAGVRCPDCARMRRLPMYNLSPSHYARAIGIGVAVAIIGGVVGSFLPLPDPGQMYLFGLIIALIGGMGAGSATAWALDRGVGKRGPTMQIVAAVGLAVAGLIRFVLLDLPWGDLPQDFAGLILIGAAIATAWGRLR